MVDSSSPRCGEKVGYYSTVCLETGEVEWMELEANSNSGTSVTSLEQLHRRHGGRLNVIWDNAPAHRGEAMRSYLKTPGLDLRLVNLPGYSPDFNADEAICVWTSEEATGNLCLGSRVALPEHSAIKDRKSRARLLAPLPAHPKLTSQLGLVSLFTVVGVSS